MRRSGPLRRSSPLRRTGLRRARRVGTGYLVVVRCKECGREFEARASRMRVFCSRACSNAWARRPEQRERLRRREKGRPAPQNRGRGNGRYKTGKDTGAKAWKDAVGSECSEPGCLRKSRALHNHHVVYAQVVRAEGGAVYDLRNALTLCASCHGRHHFSPSGRLPLTTLRDENFAFAAELLGAGAYYWLRRHYVGEDPRLDALASMKED